MKTFVELIQDNTDTFDKQINVNFLLKIKYNQNHDIQGTIQWLDQKKNRCFSQPDGVDFIITGSNIF